MGYKAAAKAKAKVSYAKAATFAGKGSKLKTIHYGKGSKSEGFAVGKKSEMIYGPHRSLARKMHDVGHGLQMAVGTQAGLEEATASRQEKPEAELAEELVSHVADTTPDVNALCETYGLRREELGRLTGFSLRALAAWAAGELPSVPAKRRLQEVRRLLDALAEIVKKESIAEWLRQPNAAFDRLSPLQVIELGEIDRLWAMVQDLGSGQPE